MDKDTTKMTYEELHQMLAEKPPRDYLPKEGEKYFYINKNGRVEYAFYFNEKADFERIRIGNYFKSEDEASEYRIVTIPKKSVVTSDTGETIL